MNSVCPNSLKLVKESNNKQILHISTETINEVVEEITKDYEMLIKLMETQKSSVDGKSLTPEQNILYEKINRNKRGVLIYLNERLNKLENITWDCGKAIPSHVLEKFDEVDQHFQSEYYKNLNTYCKTIFGQVDMDLTKNINPPNDSIYISVRAEETIKKIKLNEYDEEEISIEKGSTYMLKKSDVEPLVRRGIFSYNE
jgi:hypothetical protein